jgi:hypothetical protein
MSNDCLVTKLKGSVNNSNLKKLGVLRLPIAPTSGAKATFVQHYAGLDPCVVTIYHSDGTVAKTFNSSPSDNKKYVYIDLPNGGYAEITNKYNLFGWDERYGNAVIYLTTDLDKYPSCDEIKYCEHIDTVGTRDYWVNYAKLPDSLNVIFNGAYQLGDVMDFINAMRTKGITSKTIKCSMRYLLAPDYIAPTASFNGVIIGSSTYTTDSNKPDIISWDATKAFVRVANGTLIYCVGYTDEQIVTLTAAGGDWEGATVNKTD